MEDSIQVSLLETRNDMGSQDLITVLNTSQAAHHTAEWCSAAHADTSHIHQRPSTVTVMLIHNTVHKVLHTLPPDPGSTMVWFHAELGED